MGAGAVGIAAVGILGAADPIGSVAAGLLPGILPPFDAIHCANWAGLTASTAIGMKPWRAPHSSLH